MPLRLVEKLPELSDDYFSEVSRPLSYQERINVGIDLIGSPLALARHNLASYVAVVLWEFYAISSDYSNFDKVFTYMDRITKGYNYGDWSEVTSDELEQLTLAFRENLLALEASEPHLRKKDAEELVAELDKMLNTCADLRLKRHPRSEVIQRHFYHTVAMAWVGRRKLILSGKGSFDVRQLPAVFLSGCQERDKLYLDQSDAEGRAYLTAVETLMSDPDYGKWISTAQEQCSHFEPLGLNELPELSLELETEMLWYKHTRN